MTPLSLSDKTKRNTLLNNGKLYRPLNCPYLHRLFGLSGALTFPHSLHCSKLGGAWQQLWWVWRSGTSLKQKSKHHTPKSAGEANFHPQAQLPLSPPDTQAFTSWNRFPPKSLCQAEQGHPKIQLDLPGLDQTSPVHLTLPPPSLLYQVLQNPTLSPSHHAFIYQTVCQTFARQRVGDFKVFRLHF